MSDEARPGDGGFGAPAKRGRPRKQESAGGTTNGSGQLESGASEFNGGTSAEPEPERISGHAVIDPLRLPDAGTGDSEPRKRRGRKPKSTQGEEEVPNLGSLQIKDLLITACFFLGNAAQAPELYASEAEATKVEAALVEFSKYHTVGLSPRRLSEINLAIVGGTFVGTRLYAMYKRAPKRPGPRVLNIRPESAAASGGQQGATVAAEVPSSVWVEPTVDEED